MVAAAVEATSELWPQKVCYTRCWLVCLPVELRAHVLPLFLSLCLALSLFFSASTATSFFMPLVVCVAVDASTFGSRSSTSKQPPEKRRETTTTENNKKKDERQQRLQKTWANVPHKNSCHTSNPLPFLSCPSLVNPYAALCQHIFGEQQQRLTVTFSGASNVPFACHLPHAACHLPSPDCLPAFEKGSFLSVDMIFHDILALLLFLACCDFCGPQNTKPPVSLACLSVFLFMLFAFFCVRQLVELP